KTEQKNITAIRIEALTDPSLPKNGPGRAANGSFVLTDFKVRVKPPKAEAAAQVTMDKPRATSESKNQTAAAAFDETEASGWSIDPQIRKDHAAVFDFLEPLNAREGGPSAEPNAVTTLTFQLDFKKPKQQILGKLRISVCTSDAPAPLEAGSGIAESIVRALE